MAEVEFRLFVSETAVAERVEVGDQRHLRLGNTRVGNIRLLDGDFGSKAVIRYGILHMVFDSRVERVNAVARQRREVVGRFGNMV